MFSIHLHKVIIIIHQEPNIQLSFQAFFNCNIKLQQLSSLNDRKKCLWIELHWSQLGEVHILCSCQLILVGFLSRWCTTMPEPSLHRPPPHDKWNTHLVSLLCSTHRCREPPNWCGGPTGTAGGTGWAELRPIQHGSLWMWRLRDFSCPAVARASSTALLPHSHHAAGCHIRPRCKWAKPEVTLAQ